MVELAGALCNQEVPVRWRELVAKHEALLARRTLDPGIELATEASNRRAGWVWRGLVSVLAAADSPFTPTQAQALLEDELGEPVAFSTVKDCLRRHAEPNGPLRRYKGGRYVLRKGVVR